MKRKDRIAYCLPPRWWFRAYTFNFRKVEIYDRNQTCDILP